MTPLLFILAQVDEYSRTSVPSIYAVGDVTDRMNLTPVALMEGMALAKTLFGDEGPVSPDHSNIASAVFTQPPMATVVRWPATHARLVLFVPDPLVPMRFMQGMTEEEAVEKLGNVDVYTSAFRPMKNTISGNPGRAFMKLVVDADTDVASHPLWP